MPEHRDGGVDLVVEFSDREELSRFAARASSDGGCLVPVERPLRLFSEVDLELRWRRLRLAVSARVIQLFEAPDGGRRAALEVSDVAALEALAAAAGPAAGGGTAVGGQSADAPEEEAVTRAAEPEAVSTGETLGVSPVFRLREMNVPERRRLAPKASRTERQLLLRDSSPQVLVALLSNPRIEDREVLELVKSPQAPGGLLERVGKDPRWIGSYDIRLAVVKNPRTPTPLAQRLLNGLNKKDLGVLAKSGQVREAVRGAALRLYLKRM